MNKPHTLICTVGTSLKGNLVNLPEKEDLSNKSKSPKGVQTLQNYWPLINKIKKAYLQNNYPEVGRLLTEIPDTTDICGAEINSIAALLQKGFLNLQKIVFLTSDTEDGDLTGKILSSFYKTRKKELGLQQVDYRRILDIQDKIPYRFKTYGLRNLVREIGDIVGSAGDLRNVAINATGGYKAQIAIAVLIGQSLDLPVYYKHERFHEIISFPPMPVSLDYSLIGTHGHLLAAFERGEMITSKEIGDIDEKLRTLLEEIEEEGQTCWTLSSIGQIYLTGFRLRYPKKPNLPEVAPEARKYPTYGNDHHKPGNNDQFKRFVEKIWREVPWIKTCYTVPYNGQSAIRGKNFYLQPTNNGFEIIGTYKLKDFGNRFKIISTAESEVDYIWAVDYLNRQYGSDD